MIASGTRSLGHRHASSRRCLCCRRVGKVEDGPVIGDNLATAIYSKSGNGVVHDAAVRDLDGIKEIPGFTSFCQGMESNLRFTNNYADGG